MQRIASLNPETTTGKSKEMFDAVQKKFGVVPNMIRAMGNSPAVLNAYLTFSAAMDSGSLGSGLNKYIALAVANQNQCDYCNSIHSYLAENLLKIDVETINLAKAADSTDKKIRAALQFAVALVRKRGKLDEDDFNEIKSAGFSDAQVAEVISVTVLNIFTNYFNTAFQIELDFPKTELVEPVLIF